jgi:hypothetical protein
VAASSTSSISFARCRRSARLYGDRHDHGDAAQGDLAREISREVAARQRGEVVMRKGRKTVASRHHKHEPGGLGGRGGRGGGHRKRQVRTAEAAPLDVPGGTLKRRPEQIARVLKEVAEAQAGSAKPSPYRAAMTWLSQQAERLSKKKEPEQRQLLVRAKDSLRSLFGMEQNRKGEGGVRAKRVPPRRRRKSTMPPGSARRRARAAT